MKRSQMNAQTAEERLAKVIFAHPATNGAAPTAPEIAALCEDLAAVVLAHLEAQGWARGREEWGYESMSQSLEPCIRFASSKASALGFAHIGANGRAVRRRVTDWEPVDG